MTVRRRWRFGGHLSGRLGLSRDLRGRIRLLVVYKWPAAATHEVRRLHRRSCAVKRTHWQQCAVRSPLRLVAKRLLPVRLRPARNQGSELRTSKAALSESRYLGPYLFLYFGGWLVHKLHSVTSVRSGWCQCAIAAPERNLGLEGLRQGPRTKRNAAVLPIFQGP